MKKLLTEYLERLGYTNITFHKERNYFILAQHYNSTMCIDIAELVNEILRKELNNTIDK